MERNVSLQMKSETCKRYTRIPKTLRKWPIFKVLQPKIEAEYDMVIVFGDNDATSALIVTTEKRVYGMGNNSYGQLGFRQRKENNTVTKPKEIVQLRGMNIKTIYTMRHSVFMITEEGKIYAWGDNTLGLLGLGVNADAHVYEPTQITLLSMLDIVDISCVIDLALALTKDGRMYTWGSASDFYYKCTPIQIDLEKNVEYIACNNKFNVIVTENGNGYVWIKTEMEVIRDKNDVQMHIILYRIVFDAKIGKVLCGLNHALALTREGYLITWDDSNRNFDLSDSRFIYNPKLVESINGKVLDFAVLPETNMNAAVCENGLAYMWGCFNRDIDTPIATSFWNIHDVFASNVTYRMHKPLIIMNSLRNTNVESMSLRHEETSAEFTSPDCSDTSDESTGSGHRDTNVTFTSLGRRKTNVKFTNIRRRKTNVESTNLRYEEMNAEFTSPDCNDTSDEFTGLGHRDTNVAFTSLGRRKTNVKFTNLRRRKTNVESINLRHEEMNAEFTSLGRRKTNVKFTNLRRRKKNVVSANLRHEETNTEFTSPDCSDTSDEHVDLGHRDTNVKSMNLGCRDTNVESTNLGRRETNVESTDIRSRSVEVCGSGESLNLRWQTFLPITDCINVGKFNDENSCDFILKVGNKCIFLHKSILVNRCAYFKRLNTSQWNEPNMILLGTFSYEIYETFFKYLYTDLVKISMENLEDLVKLMKMYNLTDESVLIMRYRLDDCTQSEKK